MLFAPCLQTSVQYDLGTPRMDGVKVWTSGAFRSTKHVHALDKTPADRRSRASCDVCGEGGKCWVFCKACNYDLVSELCGTHDCVSVVPACGVTWALAVVLCYALSSVRCVTMSRVLNRLVYSPTHAVLHSRRTGNPRNHCCAILDHSPPPFGCVAVRCCVLQCEKCFDKYKVRQLCEMTSQNRAALSGLTSLLSFPTLPRR